MLVHSSSNNIDSAGIASARKPHSSIRRWSDEISCKRFERQSVSAVNVRRFGSVLFRVILCFILDLLVVIWVVCYLVRSPLFISRDFRFNFFCVITVIHTLFIFGFYYSGVESSSAINK